ncbi:hypothetical protein [Ruegeria atlantica]|uniref:hypothetical protein n=1 Tax=Ruegeria atlantica TaxID=81569 RepID=UPI00147B7BE0|nr:hypothetical protein [Ruegeria atlantica]
MAVENVKLNSGDNKSEVAYQMALSMWQQSNQGKSPNRDSKAEFLDLVQDCVRALQPRYAYSYSKEDE